MELTVRADGASRSTASATCPWQKPIVAKSTASAEVRFLALLRPYSEPSGVAREGRESRPKREFRAYTTSAAGGSLALSERWRRGLTFDRRQIRVEAGPLGC